MNKKAKIFIILIILAIVIITIAWVVYGRLRVKRVYEKSSKVDVLDVDVVKPAYNFILNETNAKKMIGKNDAENERWADIAGNFYSSTFCRKFSYEDTNGPIVWISIKPVAETLKGRLEAHGLKPNFAYQLKLMGNFLDKT